MLAQSLYSTQHSSSLLLKDIPKSPKPSIMSPAILILIQLPTLDIRPKLYDCEFLFSLGYRYYTDKESTTLTFIRCSMYRILSHSSLPVAGKVPSSNSKPTNHVTMGMSLNFSKTSSHLLHNEDIWTISEITSGEKTI